MQKLVCAQEQLIYPKPAGGSDVGVAELTELLAAVDLDYLLDRHGMHATVDWGAVLSLGACFFVHTRCVTNDANASQLSSHSMCANHPQRNNGM